MLQASRQDMVPSQTLMHLKISRITMVHKLLNYNMAKLSHLTCKMAQHNPNNQTILSIIMQNNHKINKTMVHLEWPTLKIHLKQTITDNKMLLLMVIKIPDLSLQAILTHRVECTNNLSKLPNLKIKGISSLILLTIVTLIMLIVRKATIITIPHILHNNQPQVIVILKLGQVLYKQQPNLQHLGQILYQINLNRQQ